MAKKKKTKKPIPKGTLFIPLTTTEINHNDKALKGENSDESIHGRGDEQ